MREGPARRPPVTLKSSLTVNLSDFPIVRDPGSLVRSLYLAQLREWSMRMRSSSVISSLSMISP